MGKDIRGLMAEKIRDFRLPRYNELPNMGLYLEQVTKYINGTLAPLGCMEITSSMISNYVKQGIVSAPVKKQYYKEQIAYLFVIGITKNVLSMENIRRLFNIQKVMYNNDTAYNYFCDEFENMIGYIYGFKDKLDNIGVTSTQIKLLFRSIITSASHMIYINNGLGMLEDEVKS